MKSDWRKLLWPIALIYGAVVCLRNLFFDLVTRFGLLDAEAGATVISIGNLSAGGTGKTPMAIFLSERWKAAGLRVGVVSRGYGRSTRGSLAVDTSRGDRATRYGDEPSLIAERTGLPVQVGEKRLVAARDLVAREGVPLVLLDDGFQHRWINRVFDIILIDASEPENEFHLLPVGRLREPLSSLRRADLVILTKTNRTSAENVAALEERVRSIRTGIPVLRFVDELEWSSAGVVVLAAGIARPESFFESVRALSVPIATTRAFDDHHVFRPHDAAELATVAKDNGAARVVVTEKDFSKLHAIWPASSGVALESSRLVMRPARESDRRELERLDERIFGLVRGTGGQNRRSPSLVDADQS